MSAFVSNSGGPREAIAMSRVVQIALQDQSYATQLCRALRMDPTFEGCQIVCGRFEEMPGEPTDGVRVIDAAHLPRLPQPLGNPAKTVLIAAGTVDLEQAWKAGIISVLQNNESLEYVKLAILAALLRPAKPHLAEPRRK